jgi:hypothetical protein
LHNHPLSATVTVRLTVKEHVHGHRLSAITAKDAVHTVVVGELHVTLAAGQSRVITLSLNAAGKRLLKARGSFNARLQLRVKGATLRTQTVVIARPAKHQRSSPR